MSTLLRTSDSPFEANAERFDQVGVSVPRADSRQKLTGRAIYMEDIRLAGMLYGKMLRSAFAYGRVVSIDASKALKLAGGVVVATGDDVDQPHG